MAKANDEKHARRAEIHASIVVETQDGERKTRPVTEVDVPRIAAAFERAIEKHGFVRETGEEAMAKSEEEPPKTDKGEDE